MRNNKRLLALILAMGFSQAQALAADKDDAAKIWDTLAPAWDKVSAKLIKFAGEDKQKLLADLAFAAVAASQCEGLDLDRDKFKGEFDSLNDADYKALTPAAQAEYGPKLMSYYGIYVGLLTAEGLLDKAPFCRYALDKQAKGEGRYWTAAKADTK